MEDETELAPLASQASITHAWLQQVLVSGLGTNLKLESWSVHEPEKRHGFASDISFVKVSYKVSPSDDLIQSSMVLKFMPENKAMAEFVTNGNLSVREVEFYKYAASKEFKTFCQNINSHYPIPLVYWAGLEGDRVTVTLENMNDKNYKSLTPPEGISLAQVKNTLSKIAIIHAAGFSNINRHKITKLDIPWDAAFLEHVVEVGLQRFIKMFANTPTAGTLKSYWPLIRNLVYTDQAHPFLTTLIHGDLWTGNVMFSDDGEDVKILDWQFAHFGNPVCDIMSLLFLSSAPSVYNNNLTEVLECYWTTFQQALAGNGVVLEQDITFQDLLRNVEDMWLYGFMFFMAAAPDLLDYGKLSEERARSVILFLEKREVLSKSVHWTGANNADNKSVPELPPLNSDKEISRRWLEEMLGRKCGCPVTVSFWSVRLPEGREGFLSEIAFVEVQYVRQEALQMDEGKNQNVQAKGGKKLHVQTKGVKQLNVQDKCRLEKGGKNVKAQDKCLGIVDVEKDNSQPTTRSGDQSSSMEENRGVDTSGRPGTRSEQGTKKEQTCRLVFKFLPQDPALLLFLSSGGLAEREVEFYKFLNSKEFKDIQVEVSVPEVYFAGFNKEAITLILQDLNQDQYSIVIVKDGSSLDQTKTALRAMAVIHAAGCLFLEQYGRESSLLSTLALEFKVEYDRFFVPNLHTLVKMYEGTSLAKIFRALIPLTQEIFATSRRNPLIETIVHGDLWAGQLLYSHDQKAASIIDWQFCHLDNPVSDIMSMFFMSTDPKVLENNLQEILEDYLKTFCEVLERGKSSCAKSSKVIDLTGEEKIPSGSEENIEDESSCSLKEIRKLSPGPCTNVLEGEAGMELLAANIEQMWMYGFLFLAASLHDFLNGDNISRYRLDEAMFFLERRGVFSKFLAKYEGEHKAG